ncbi:AAA family ATPase [Streptomyces sp. NPDC102274]|uniref:nSTAND1 domain-containing NTPase n=1 Tax=Streptomyces sp. NPDC102274 TaxID=3366151 RepID=UPI003825A72A
MARGERPLDEGDGPLLGFAADLRGLRQKAGGPTYRVLSQRTHYSIATLSSAAAGRSLPTLAVTLAYVRACDGDVAEWERTWHTVAARLAAADDAGPDRDAERSDAGGDANPPYAGLAAFQPEDADRFFGRERLTEEMFDRLSRQRFVAVFGASGSGKSSLLRAGLLPRLRADGVRRDGAQRERTRNDGTWQDTAQRDATQQDGTWRDGTQQEPGERDVVLLTPGPHPLEECAIRLSALARTVSGQVHADLVADPRNLHRLVRQILTGRPEGAEIVLIIDQFEETFTLCRSPEERTAFIAALIAAVRAPNSRCRVVLGTRADFYAHCARHADLVEALTDAQIMIGPMTGEELRRAVVRPAVSAGSTVEGALVATLVAQAHDRPGVLPLLSHALLETWRRRRGNALTLAGFQATGGIEGALARTAETFHASLTPGQQRIARQIFLRLTALGEGTQDTKRRLPRGELDQRVSEVDLILERAASVRLLTLDRDQVEIAHEALIRCWPRLHGWLAEDREGLRTQRRLTEAAEVWESLGRDPGALYRGVSLATARDLTDPGRHPHGAVLTAREREFLDAGLAAERAETLRDRSRTRRLRRLVALLAVLTVAATFAAGFALRAQQQITRQRDAILSRNVTAEALILRQARPELATQLLLAAYRLAPTPEARDGLLSTVSTSLAGHTDIVTSVSYSRDGRLLAVGAANGTVRLWNMSDPRRPVGFPAFDRSDWVASVSFSPDGRTLATGGYDRRARLWDVSDPARPALRATLSGHTDAIFSVAFGPDGRTLATGSYDHTVRLWNVAAGTTPTSLATLTGHTLNVKSVAFSGDGKLLASGGDDRTVRLWDIRRPRHPVALSVLRGHHNYVTSVAFSPDGRTLVSGSDDRTVRLWNITLPRRPAALSVLSGHSDVVISVAFSGDGRLVASGSYDRSARLWDTGDIRHPALRAVLTGHSGAINAVTFAPGGRAVVTGGDDRTARVWQTDPRRAVTEACAASAPAIRRSQWSRYFPGLDYRPPCQAP